MMIPMKNPRLSTLLVLLLTCFLLISAGCELQVLDLPPNPYEYRISNPYEDIEWETIEYHDANFHTHTQLSDAQMLPHTVIDTYHSLGYSVLALTDHNTKHYITWPSTLYPWTEFSSIQSVLNASTSSSLWQDRAPVALNMVSVEGSEISQNHHIGSWFNSFVGITQTEDETLASVTAGGGLAVFNHPGRYDKTDAWYVDMFLRYPVLIGLEIFNQQDRYADDRERWDKLLYQTMPDRPVWGFGNDDMHSRFGLGWNRNVLLLKELTESAVRYALEKGQFFVFKPHIREALPDIQITDIQILNDTIQLEIEGEFNSIQWLTYYSETQNSEIICIGETFSTTDLPMDAPFVRAVVFSNGGRLFTQPFGVDRMN